VTVLDEQQVSHPVDALKSVTDPTEIEQVQRAVREVYIDPLIKQYIVALAGATRQHEDVYLGASPRGSIALLRTSQASALLEGRDYVIPDDVKSLAFVSLEHRIIISPGARVKGTSAADILADCLSRVSVPGTHPKD
jgi:MoxR-like ATPase